MADGCGFLQEKCPSYVLSFKPRDGDRTGCVMILVLARKPGLHPMFKSRFFRWIRYFTGIDRVFETRPQSLRMVRSGTRHYRPTLEHLETRVAPAVVNTTWLGGVGDWSNAAQWDTGVVPNNNDGSGNTYNVF